ncbi:capsid protein [Porcine lymphotropic herpesvirus 3]|uniref:Capsid protein n=1 Tax=Suid gammaherpesvirus 5 TaxID=1960251 RepID=Q8B3Z5_9GAMA|nr:capsid protein [Porcine lymphotropic herpesvirus 3]AAO12330.1 capsid protein [Porcine lymphotropic herpesvirus 3]
MFTDSKITISLTSRLYADEISKLQEKIGAVVPIEASHGIQNIQSLGLAAVANMGASSDYVLMFNYLSKCTLAVLDEVNTDSLILTKIQRDKAYQIKNVYQPFFQWSNNIQLCVMPPMFDKDLNSIELESNNYTIIFPAVVPVEVAHDALQKLLLYNIYSRVLINEPDPALMREVTTYCNYVTYLGVHYQLNIEANDASASLRLLDNLAMYLSIMTVLLPRGCTRLLTSLVRYGEHELLELFRRLVPDEMNVVNLERVSIYEDLTKLGMLMTYLQTLGAVFNLGPRLQVSLYVTESLLATCWCSD